MISRFTLAFLLAAALNARAFDSVAVFNELQFHPASEATETEWIELRSLQAVDVDISGWSIAGDIQFTFPANLTLPGGGYLTIARVPGQIAGARGPFTGQLGNGSGTVRLLNQNGRIMDELRYEDGGDWPVGADGSGATLARREASAKSGPGAWAASTELGGTPGAQNFYEGAAAVRTRAIAIGASWKYEDSGATPPAGWQAPGFDDSAWKSGATLIAGGGGKLGGATKPGALADGLLAYWPFDETSGTTADNTVIGQPDGTMANGATFVADSARGRVAEFDGTNDRMEVIDPGTGLPSLGFLPSMTNANDFTWAAWVWSSTPSTLSDQFGSVILGNRTGPDGADTMPREFIKILPTAMQYHRNAATENLDYTDLPTSAWTHICVVKRGLTLESYINGALAVSRTLTGGLSNPLPFYVGGDRSGTGSNSAEHFAGRVDDVALWTRALSTSKIAQLGGQYGATPPLPSPPEQTTTAATGTQPRYFRKTFTFSGTPDAASLELWPVADDGAVIYLNGTEIWRLNVPPTSEAGDAVFPSSPITISNAALVKGTNVLAAEVHQFPGGNTDLLFGADLVITSVPGPAPAPPPSLIFNEIAGAGDPAFYLELRNTAAAATDTAGWTLRTSTGQSIELPAGSIAAGGYLTLDRAALGFTPVDGMRFSLIAPGGNSLRDSREVTSRRRGLTDEGRWGYPTAATPGGANVVTVSDAIVINEIFYHGLGASPEQWIELHNRGAEAVNIGRWKLSDGVDYTFAAGMTIPAGGFLVVAWDPAAFAALHPGVSALGPWTGSLAKKGELVRLRDAEGNVADEVRYFDGGLWPEFADGGGSSLELRDSRADNSKGEAWEASDESAASPWQTVSYSGPATNANGSDPTTYNEFVFGLLADGEFLIDDISVKNVTQGNVELIQNGSFSGGTTAAWRIIGTHTGTIVDDPAAPGNKVLKVSATGATEHMHNHAETTLKNGTSYHAITATDTYSISFRVKRLRGSNRLHTRLWHNRLARQTLLPVPATGGTPGAPNGSRVTNLGPTFDSLTSAPVVPAASQPATVSIQVTDLDGIGSMQLFTSVNGGSFTGTPMTGGGDGIYSATIPGKSSGTLVQFYVQATDALGAVSFFPPAGPASRAMIPWADGRAQLTLASGARPHNIRVVLPSADASELYKAENLMSDAAVPCTVILNEGVAFYRAGVRLKSSEHGRITDARCGYTLEFPSDDLFLDVHDTIAIDRSGGTSAGQKEILLKRLSNTAGGVYASEDDICRVISAVGTAPPGQFNGAGLTGAAILSKTRLDKEFLDAQWDHGGDGSQHKYERIYVLTETIHPTTRVRTAISTSNILTAVSEQPKVPQSSSSPLGLGVTSLGANKENYRWYWLLQNNREADDFSGIMNVTNAVGQPGGSSAFNTLTNQHIDVNAWLRACVPSALYGVQDNYLGTGGAQHNALIYFPPGRKAVLIPWDLDTLQTNTTSSLTAGGDATKFIANPVWKRLYYGHMLDILNRSFNTTYMTKWAAHYSRFGTEDMTLHVSSYLTPRATFARDVINGTNGQIAPIPQVPFRITTANPLTVDTPFTTIVGDGWVDVAEIRLAGSMKPLAVTWTDDNSWSLPLPVQAGTNSYTVTAHNSQGTQVGMASITITGSGGVFPAGPGNLVVSELNYNPPGSSDATEFIELLNITGATLDLSGCHFDEELGQGITYTFPTGVQLAAGARILVVRDTAAFNAQYGTGLPLAPGVFAGALDNSGESIVLYASSGQEIFRFAYRDDLAAPDGGGKTLVRVLSSSAPNLADYTWRASTQNGGNPNGSDAIAFTGNMLADADGDGLRALLEYTLGTSDNMPAQTAPLTFLRDPFGACFVAFSRAANADDATLTIESTPSLDAAWAPAAATLNSTSTAGAVVTETWQITPPASGTSFFVRLKASPR